MFVFQKLECWVKSTHIKLQSRCLCLMFIFVLIAAMVNRRYTSYKVKKAGTNSMKRTELSFFAQELIINVRRNTLTL